jgi:hypothetical protein
MHIITVARSFLGSGLLTLALSAAAQTNSASIQSVSEAEPSNRVSGSATGNFFLSGSAADQIRLDKLLQERNHRIQELQRRLADPQQRAKVRGERIQQVRANLPDLSRIAQLDTDSEAKLFGLLADQQLALEMRPNGFAALEPVFTDEPRISADALEHTLLMRDISQELGTKVLDAYLDYLPTARYRIEVEKLQAALPAAAKLGLQQKDGLTTALLAAEEERYERTMLQMPHGFGRDDFGLAGRLTAAEFERRSRIQTIVANEAIAVVRREEHRELLARVASLLRPEQLQVLATQLQRDVDSLLRWTRQRRHELGIDPQAQLEAPTPRTPPPPALERTVRLMLTLHINGKNFTKTITSTRGAAVSFDGPEGLWLQTRPYLITADALRVDIRVFEPVEGGRRMIGRTCGSTELVDPSRQSAVGSSTSRTILFGRKGYDVTWSITASYL